MSAEPLGKEKRSHYCGDVRSEHIGNKVVVIEVNDNPSIESGVEDKYLGQQLYLRTPR